jgi:hypothetical protein
LSAGGTRAATKTTSATVYDRNFQQHLIDHNVYPDKYEYPDGRIPAMPKNWEEINERLALPRASLSPSKFNHDDFRKFKRADKYASKDNPVTRSVIPIIEGDIGDPQCVGADYPFGNLVHLTDGSLACAKPNLFYGARPERLDRKIRNELSDKIIPSTQDDLPMLPNFFSEVKGPDGTSAVVMRSACYDGALGARAMHYLQSYKQDKLVYDNNARTITSTYLAGKLKLYTIHIIAPKDENDRPEYIMTRLHGYSMTGDHQTFLKGASAYRNARDWAKEQRDEFIEEANKRHNESQFQSQSASEQDTTSDLTEDSDTSTELAEAEFHDAAQ